MNPPTEWPVLSWDAGPPWVLHLGVVPEADQQTFRMAGTLQREGESIPISKPTLILAGGPVFIDNRAAAMEDFGAWAFIKLLRGENEINVPFEQTDEFLAELLRFPRLPRLDLPPEMQTTEMRLTPRPRLRIIAGNKKKRSNDSVLSCRVSFDYDSQTIALDNLSPAILDSQKRQIIHRDFAAERSAVAG